MNISKVTHLTGHTGAIYCLEYFKDDSFFSAGFDNLVVLWTMNNENRGVVTAKLKSKAISLLYLKEKNWLIAGQSTGGVHIIDLDSNEEIGLFQGHQGMIYTLCYNKNLNVLYVGAEDGKISCWDLESFRSTWVINLSRGKIRDIQLIDNLLYVGSEDGSIGVFTQHELEDVAYINQHMENFSVNSILKANNTILSGSRDGHINVIDISDQKFSLKKRIPAHNFAIYKIVKSPDGNYYATASRDKSIKIWNSNNDFVEKIDFKSYKGHIASVNDLIWFDNYLVSAGDDKSIIIWEVKY